MHGSDSKSFLLSCFMWCYSQKQSLSTVCSCPSVCPRFDHPPVALLGENSVRETSSLPLPHHPAALPPLLFADFFFPFCTLTVNWTFSLSPILPLISLLNIMCIYLFDQHLQFHGAKIHSARVVHFSVPHHSFVCSGLPQNKLALTINWFSLLGAVRSPPPMQVADVGYTSNMVPTYCVPARWPTVLFRTIYIILTGHNMFFWEAASKRVASLHSCAASAALSGP